MQDHAARRDPRSARNRDRSYALRDRAAARSCRLSQTGLRARLVTGAHPALARRPCSRCVGPVAIYYLSVKTFGRGSGSSGVSAAAYRAGERIRDERAGRIFDHSHRTNVMHKEIVLPSRFTAADMRKFQDRAWLWNAVEIAETRANAAIAREYLVALPTS